MPHTIICIYTTFPNQRDAEDLARKALEGKKSACINIIPQVTSLYEWEGTIEKSSECIALFKTTENNAESLLEWLHEHHPYDVPALLKAPVETSKDFYDYVTKQTQNNKL